MKQEKAHPTSKHRGRSTDLLGKWGRKKYLKKQKEKEENKCYTQNLESDGYYLCNPNQKNVELCHKAYLLSYK